MYYFVFLRKTIYNLIYDFTTSQPDDLMYMFIYRGSNLSIYITNELKVGKRRLLLIVPYVTGLVTLVVSQL